MTPDKIEELFDSFSSLRIGVIGDVMVDAYIWGSVERISPEAPVPIVSVKKRELRIGGAGNVAMNLQALGVSVQVLSVIGADLTGDDLKRLFAQRAIQTNYLLESGYRSTTCKTRVISHNQQMIRLDEEVADDLQVVEEEELLKNLSAYILDEKPHLLIFEDYNKGVLTPMVIKKALELCSSSGVITAVDPKRKNFFLYVSADIIKPNYREVRDVLGVTNDEVSLEKLSELHVQLKEKLNHSISFISLSESGVFYQKEKELAIVPSHVRKIADVSGAGDTVIAVGSAVYALTGNVNMMAEIANVAGGLVCEEVGTAIIDKNRLLHETKRLVV